LQKLAKAVCYPRFYNTGQLAMRRNQAGFSAIELMVVVAIILVIVVVALLMLNPALRGGHLNTAVQTTVSQIRMARQSAMDRRMLYSVTFTAPGTIVTTRLLQGQPPVVERTVTLPSDTQFLAQAGLPGAGKTPDQFGSGASAIDFDQAAGGGGNVIFFYPDGTALDAVGDPNDGVIYIALPGNVNTSRAITLWGATGRVKTFYLAKTTTGGLQWH
jgi:prepilin-type N-terminal cleavage/methylation domain-containing protein